MIGHRRGLRLPQVKEKTGLGETQIREAVRRGIFPKPFLVLPGGRAVAWDEGEIDAYLAGRMAERDAPPIEPTPKARKRRAIEAAA
jgi:prophage regulatory protein